MRGGGKARAREEGALWGGRTAGSRPTITDGKVAAKISAFRSNSIAQLRILAGRVGRRRRGVEEVCARAARAKIIGNFLSCERGWRDIDE